MPVTRYVAWISTVVDPGKLDDNYYSFPLHSLHRKKPFFSEVMSPQPVKI